MSSLISKIGIAALVFPLTFSLVLIPTVSTVRCQAKSTAYAPAALNAGLPPLTSWLPTTQPRAVVLCLHGLGLHMGSYADLGTRLSREGVAVYAMDARGFGTYMLKNETTVDFDQTLSDIGLSLVHIAKTHPETPIFLLGESMGGAIALQASAKYQDKLTGLICAVPSGDRFGDLNQDLKVGLHVLTGGFEQRYDVGSAVIKHATKDESHQQEWANDPRARKMYSPAELLTFQRFMNKNFEAAATIKSLHTLFVQGAQDKLVRPTGTWDVYDHLATPNRRLALSTGSEHLIFENGRFNNDDINFVLRWMTQAEAEAKAPPDMPPPEPSDKTRTAQEKLASETVSARNNLTTEATAPDTVSALYQRLKSGSSAVTALVNATPSLSYWIELKRDGKIYRCNNKMSFRSGDEIRFHIRSGNDGFAYILMNQGSKGTRAVLFPEQRTGTDNKLQATKDNAIPTMTFLKFDNNPGVERLSLVFSGRQVDLERVFKDPHTITAFVSADRTGAKDLVPTRMQLSWDEPSPVLMPQAVGSQVAKDESSLVKVSYNADDVIVIDIALDHK